MTMKRYAVDVEYTVYGTVYVYAKDEASAREAASWEMQFPGTLDLSDSRVENVRVVEDADAERE